MRTMFGKQNTIVAVMVIDSTEVDHYNYIEGVEHISTKLEVNI